LIQAEENVEVEVCQISARKAKYVAGGLGCLAKVKHKLAGESEDRMLLCSAVVLVNRADGSAYIIIPMPVSECIHTPRFARLATVL
jgi:hypothetical protein